jgi:signal transduction histidine kinase
MSQSTARFAGALVRAVHTRLLLGLVLWIVFPGPAGAAALSDQGQNTLGRPLSVGYSLAFSPRIRQLLGLNLLGGTGFLVAGALFHARRLRLQRRMGDLEREAAVEQERSRIARDLHDELGSGLAQVALFAEALDLQPFSQRRPQDVAREMMQKLDGIVWSLTSERADAGSVVNYLAGVAEQFLAPTPMRLRLDLPKECPPMVLASSQRHQLVLGFKEMLRNAATHSQGRVITVRVAFSGETMEVAVRDDGVGCDPALRPPYRNGLSNLERRAADLGGTFTLRPAPGKGTEAVLRFPLKPSGTSVA